MKMVSSGLLRRVIWQKFTDVSEVLADSIISAMSKPHGHVGKYLPDKTLQQPRRQPSSYSPP
jgi:hypothetical protein